MTITEKFFVECVKCGINQLKISCVPDNIDYEKLYILCVTNSVSVIVFCALENVQGQLLPQFLEKLKRSVHRQIVLDTQSEHDKNIFLSAMDEKKLKHMPLKGYHLKKMYPLTSMRYTSDCDVLIDVAQLKGVRALVEELGLKTKRHDEHHDIVYFPITKTVFELHKSVFVGPLEKYFSNIFDRATLKQGTNAFYEMSPEDFYISLLAHSAYHFAEDAGVGIRHIVDIYLYKKNVQLDLQKLNQGLAECGLVKFENQFDKLAQYFFDDSVADCETEILAKHILASSLFEKKDDKAASDIAANSNNNDISNSKFKAIVKGIFPPKSNMLFTYPILKKAGILLPFFYPVRWITVLITRPKNVLKLKDYSKISAKQVDEIKHIRCLLGIENL